MITGDHAITASAIGSQMDTAIFESMEQRRLRQLCADAGLRVSWVTPTNMHLTIRFLG